MDGNNLDAPLPAPCPQTAVASVTGRCNSYPMPLNLIAPGDVEGMTVFVDGEAIPRADWTTDGHTLTITSCVEGDKGQHLVAVGVGCEK